MAHMKWLQFRINRASRNCLHLFHKFEMVASFAFATSVILAFSSGTFTAIREFPRFYLPNLSVLAEPIYTSSALFYRQVSANIPTECLTNQCKPYYDAIGAVCYSSPCRVFDPKITCYSSTRITAWALTAGVRSTLRTRQRHALSALSTRTLRAPSTELQLKMISMASRNFPSPSFFYFLGLTQCLLISKVPENMREQWPPHFRHLIIWRW